MERLTSQIQRSECDQGFPDRRNLTGQNPLETGESFLKVLLVGAPLVAQWEGICLPMQKTRIHLLVQEDPTCCGPTEPIHAPEPVGLEPVPPDERSHYHEKLMYHNQE